ncbi:hypothetical protein N2152v2_006341 [Parachlorella kessleri]
MQGGKPFHFYNTDMDLLFRQESYFYYLFGVTDEDYYGAIDLRTGRSLLFMPRLPDSYAVWMGHIATPEEIKARYAVDDVYYSDELAATLASLQPPCLHLLGLLMSATTFEGMEKFKLEEELLFPALTGCRVIKTAEELRVMRYVSQVASQAHVEIMRLCKGGNWEFQLEAAYLQSIYSRGGCRTAHYTPIFASGPNAAVLHYGHAGAPNDRQMHDGELLLVDAGGEYYRYAADITCTFPVGGKFSALQRVVYEAVLAANRGVINAMKPGVYWLDMHLLAERIMLSALSKGGLLVGDVDAMMDSRLGAVFMPHGLGHFLGLDTHDVGGYGLPGCPPRPQQAGVNRLRTARVLQEGMVITVEPGCYFNPVLLEPALKDPAHSKFLVEERIRDCWGFGGVRIEDDVIVTANGAESMTQVPRTVEEIEAVMAGAPWPPA